MTDVTPNDPFAQEGERAAEAERRIQDRIDAESRSFAKDDGGAMQAGARPYPVPPFPAQHQRKPGLEAALDPAPMYDAPFYKGSDKLAGKIALITGADSGIGRAVAVLFAREGADVVLVAREKKQPLDEVAHECEKLGVKALPLLADVSEHEQVSRVVKQGLDHFGLRVSGIEKVVADLKAKGAEFTMELNSPRPGIQICFIRGPQGISIELLERDKKYA